MPLPKGSHVIGQKRIKNKLILFFKTKNGVVKQEERKGCKCPKDIKKPCKCK